MMVLLKPTLSVGRTRSTTHSQFSKVQGRSFNSSQFLCKKEDKSQKGNPKQQQFQQTSQFDERQQIQNAVFHPSGASLTAQQDASEEAQKNPFVYQLDSFKSMPQEELDLYIAKMWAAYDKGVEYMRANELVEAEYQLNIALPMLEMLQQLYDEKPQTPQEEKDRVLKARLSVLNALSYKFLVTNSMHSAILYYHKYISLFSKSNPEGENHWDIAVAWSNIATAIARMDKLGDQYTVKPSARTMEAAIDACNKAISIMEKTASTDKRKAYMAAVLSNKAGYLLSLERWGEARLVCKTAFKLMLDVGGRQCKYTVQCFENLVRIIRSQGEFEKAHRKKGPNLEWLTLQHTTVKQMYDHWNKQVDREAKMVEIAALKAKKKMWNLDETREQIATQLTYPRQFDPLGFWITGDQLKREWDSFESFYKAKRRKLQWRPPPSAFANNLLQPATQTIAQ